MKEYKNTEIQITENLYSLIYGPSGAGKSFFLGSVPNIVIINTDKGEKVWASRDFKGKYPGASFTVLEVEKTGYDGWIEFEKTKEHALKKCLELESKHLGIDSFTELSDMALDYAFKTNPDKKKFTGRPTLPDYGEQSRLLKELILELRSYDLSVWVIGHEDVTKDEVTGQITRHPMTVGKFARKIGKYFDLFLYMEASISGGKTTRRFTCQNTGITQAKSNVSLPNMVENPDYAKLMQSIKGDTTPATTEPSQQSQTGGGERKPQERVRLASEIGKGQYGATLTDKEGEK